MDVFDLQASLKLDKSNYDEGLSSAKESAGGLGPTLAKGLGLAAKAGVAAVTAAAGAISVVAKQAIDSFAQYEQLVGGVKKLYGEASDAALQYAQNAWKTAGVSANEYMRVTTGFTSALIQSLGGDTAKAAEMADVAMRAMSDNVNTFGSDMESVQLAFQGFAKQNYTMLDNLKLGYGGTKEEMQRLIDDANRYRATIGQTADLSIDSFADIVQAIQSVQEAQGIAGTTAKEAMTTIEGSANATKAAWQNVLTAIAGGGELSEAMDSMIAAVFGEKEGEGLLNQIIPRIEATMEGIGEFIVKASPFIADKLPELVEAILPALLESAVSLVAALVAALPGLLEVLWNTLVILITDAIPVIQQAFSGMNTGVVETLMSNLPNILNTGVEWISNLISGILQALPQVLVTVGDLASQVISTWMTHMPSFWQAGVDLILNIINGIIDNLPNIISAIFTVITELLNALLSNMPQFLQKGIEIIGELAAGLINAIPEVLAAIPQIIDAAVDAFMSFDWISIGVSIIDGVVNGIINAGGAVWNALYNVAQNAWNSVLNFFGIQSPSKLFRDTVGKNLMLGLAEGVEENDPTSDVVGTMDNVLAGVRGAVEDSTLEIPVEAGTVTVGQERMATNSQIQQILDICNRYFPHFANTKIVMDTGAVVGEMLPDIDEGLAEFALYGV